MSSSPAENIPSDVALVLSAEHTCRGSGKKVAIKSLSTGGIFQIIAAVEKVGLTAIPPAFTFINFASEDQRSTLAGMDEDIRTNIGMAEVEESRVEKMRPAEGNVMDDAQQAELAKAIDSAATFRAGAARIARERMKLVAEWGTDAPLNVRQAIKDSLQARMKGIMHYVAGAEPVLIAFIVATTDLKDSDVKSLLPVDTFEILGKAFDLIPLAATVEAAFGFFTRSSDLMAQYGKSEGKFKPSKQPETSETDRPPSTPGLST